MTKDLFFIILISVLGISLFVTSCGQQQETLSITTTTLPTSSTINLSGSLSSGSISSAGIKSYAAISSYKVVAIDSNGQTYYASTDSSGIFSIDLPEGASYEVSLIDSDAKYFGPIVMVGDASSSEVVIGIKPTEDTNLGNIVVDTSKSTAQPVTEPTSIANLSDTAKATNGIPLGAGNAGKQENSGIATREGSDMDKDGIPNLFDADEDNDGYRNGIIATPSSATVTSNTVESVQISSNIWANHDTTDDAKDLIAMRLHVYPVSGHESEIVSVECLSVPASISDVATVRWADSLGSPTNYPAEYSLWKDAGHQLYKTTTLSNNHWIISICPHAIMNVGDTFTLRVHFTGGGYQDFFLTTSYVLTDWAKISSYNDTALASNEGLKTTSEAATFSTSTLEVVISKVLDEDGNVLAGLSYSIICGSVEAGGSGTLPVPADDNSNEFRASAYPSAFTDSISSVTVTLHDLVTFETGVYYYITPVAESSDGQRNGEETWFKRE
ncbi:MAG: hypothetical protein KKA31_02110 [Candidatus Margulisbacteria bacterium]|nr:hypothetical protein [Candidatus Margulisiibacteriota bacterium]